jgi:hypothetical protein
MLIAITTPEALSLFKAWVLPNSQALFDEGLGQGDTALDGDAVSPSRVAVRNRGSIHFVGEGCQGLIGNQVLQALVLFLGFNAKCGRRTG